MNFESRAWDKVKKKFVNDYVIAPTGHIEVSIDLDNLPDPHGNNLKGVLHDLDYMGDWTLIDWTDWRAIEDYEITWYFGQKDKNQKKLFEGDYVLVPAGWSGDYWYERGVAEICWEDDCYFLYNFKQKYGVVCQDWCWNELEKIGNKYEDNLEDLYKKYNI